MKSAEQLIAEGDDERLDQEPDEGEAEGDEAEGDDDEPAEADSGEAAEGEGDDDAAEAEGDDEPAEEPPPEPRPRTRTRARSRARSAQQREREKEPNFARDSSREADQDVRSWINSLGIKTPLRIELVRKWPKRWKNHPIEGTIESFDEPIDEEDIRDMHGGGTYVLRIKAPDDKGRYVYKTQRQLKISGNPKVKNLISDDDDDDRKNSDPVTDRMMRLIEDQIADGKRGGTDTYAMIQAVMGPIQEQNKALREELREIRKASEEKDQRLLEAMTKKPDTSYQDELLKLTIGSKEGDLRELRARYDDEIRKMREDHRQELQRERDRHADDLKEVRRDAQRQIEMAKGFADSHSQVSKTSYEAQLAQLNRTIEERDRLITELRAENKELREKKDKGPLDQLQDLAQLKESFGDLGFLGGGDDEKKGVLDRLLASAEPLVGRILESQRPGQAGGGAPAPAALPAAPEQPAAASGGVVQIPEGTPAEQLPPENVPIKLPDGRRYVRRGMELHPHNPANVRRRRASAAASGRSAEASAAARKIDEAEIRTAANYLEQALENGKDPATVANSVRGFVGGDLIDYIRDHGIDDLMRLARLERGSALKTQRGKEFVRQIGEILVES